MYSGEVSCVQAFLQAAVRWVLIILTNLILIFCSICFPDRCETVASTTSSKSCNSDRWQIGDHLTILNQSFRVKFTLPSCRDDKRSSQKKKPYFLLSYFCSLLFFLHSCLLLTYVIYIPLLYFFARISLLNCISVSHWITVIIITMVISIILLPYCYLQYYVGCGNYT